ncbi:MAG: hypothetical protein J5594_00325 [Elusimicrobiaceae bacterium]|nr:hypothetical protein [Elusimicrobiaceae bacterium]
MKKNIALFISIFLLSACATFQQPKVVWTGQNFDNYVTTNGVPTSQYTLQDGNTVFSFKKSCYYDSSKTGETLVIVGPDNLITRVSTPTKCPSYYDSTDYKLDQIYQQERDEYYQRQRDEAQRKDRIKTLEGAIGGVEKLIDFEETKIKASQSLVDLNTILKDDAKVAKAQEDIRNAQNEISKYNSEKAQYERELERLR